MKICDLNTGLGRLTQAFTDLKDRWSETKNHWRDDVSKQFEEVHLREVPARLHLLMQGIQRLSSVVAKAEQECEDRPDEAGA